METAATVLAVVLLGDSGMADLGIYLEYYSYFSRTV